MPLDKQKGVQDSQFTSIAFIGQLLENEIKISMDGKSAWRDNIFIERLWRTIKYEEVYLRAYANVPEARTSIGRYIDGFYNARRLHSSLDRRTPDEAYFTSLHCSQSRLQHNHGRNPLSRGTRLFKQTEPVLIERDRDST